MATVHGHKVNTGEKMRRISVAARNLNEPNLLCKITRLNVLESASKLKVTIQAPIKMNCILRPFSLNLKLCLLKSS